MRAKHNLRHIKWEGQRFLVSQKTGGDVAPLLLNETADHILRMLKEEVSREALLASLLAAYDVDVEMLAADLDHFLEQLQQMGFLEE